MSVREDALAELASRLTAALIGAAVKRNTDVPLSVGPGGLVILRDGEPGEPEVTLSPPSYAYEHRAELEVLVDAFAPGGAEEMIDAILGDVDAMFAADRTLGGRIDYAEPDAPIVDVLAADGGSPLRTARVGLTLIYTTPSPLG